MFVVLCDVCRKHTNLTHPMGTLTKIFSGFGNNRKLKSQTVSSELEFIIQSEEDPNIERKHICAECSIVEQGVNSGWQPANGLSLPRPAPEPDSR